MDLITDIRISPKKPRPGQSVNIEVLGKNGKLLDDSMFQVHINHIPKSSVTTQYANEGEHDVVVTAVQGKDKQRKTVIIPVAGDPLTINTAVGKTLAILRASSVPNAPYKAALSIGASTNAKPTVGLGTNGLGGTFTGSNLSEASSDKVLFRNRWLGAKTDSARATMFLWEFGDGKTQKTKSLTIEHDYSSSITPKKERLVFTVRCTPLVKNGSKHPVGTLTRSLVFHSTYALLRNRGIIHPQIRAAEMLTQRGSSYFASFTANNIESETIELTHRAITPIGIDPKAIYPHKVGKLAGSIIIGASAQHKFDVEFPTKKVSVGITSIEIRFAGKSKSGMPVRISTVFDLPIKDQPQRSNDDLVPTGNGGGYVLLSAVINDRCDPDNISTEDAADAVREGLVCQLTDERETRTTPARFVNARKGDIILSPGGSGLIGSLLAQIYPAQRYSHCGIMTRNFDEIAHSTASEERLNDHRAGAIGAPGFEESALKWMWPGPVVQKVEEAINGEPWTAPEGKTYEISSFKNRAADEDFIVTPPLVVKPDPLLETPEVRSRLHAVADEARRSSSRPGEAAKGYYSLYCYSRARTGLDVTAPTDAEWAEGTFPSMCSSFIWLMARRQGVRFESPNPVVTNVDLEPSDIAVGAEVSSETLDGLYHYDEWERQNAGLWLNNNIKKMVRDEIPGLATFIGSPHRYANQVCNAFANGDASRSARRDDAWENPGSGTTVSPDNLLLWDGPDRGGLWGYAEPLLYREPREQTVQISRWRQATRSGRVFGSVALSGRPMSRTHVSLTSRHTAVTDANGRFEINDVPYGNYRIAASHSATGTNLTTERAINLNRESLRIDLVLTPPPEQYRLAEVNFEFEGIDHEAVRKNERKTGRAQLAAELGPDRTTNRLRQVYAWGGEVRVEYDFFLSLLPGNVLEVRLSGSLFEGNSESTDDRDDTQIASVMVPANGTTPFFLRLYNDERRGGDWAEIRGTVRNARNVT